MKNTFLTALIAVLTLNVSSQTMSGELFSKIQVESEAKVILLHDSACYISYNGDDNLKKKIDIKDSTLIIHTTADDQITVHMPALSEIILNGEGVVTSDYTWKVDQLHLQIKGGGKIVVNTDAKRVNAEISGLGKIVITGTAQEANFSIPGSGKIDAEGLKTGNCNVKISGLGKCIVDPIDVLNANISGNGSVVYKTAPKELNKDVSGLGSVKSLSGDGESSGNSTDTTKMEFGTKQLWIIGEKDKSSKAKKSSTKPIWAGFEMGLNSYMDNGGTFTLDPGKENFDLKVEKSEYVGLNFFQQNIEFGKSNVWLVSGLGISWNNYRFSDDVRLQNGNYISAYHDTSDVNHIKSKLVATYLMAPVMFEVFTSRKMKNAFHIGVGGMFGLRIESHTKTKLEVNDETQKEHGYDDFNLNPFRYGFRVAVGYGKFNIFADYYASTLFKENKGPVLYPVSAGITLIGF